MTNVKTKAPDYSSVADIKNPPEVKGLLDALHKQQAYLEELKSKIPVELQNEIKWADLSIQEITTQLKEAVEKHGSFQDMKAGHYAVRYRRMRRDYHVEPFVENYPDFVPAVVEKAINFRKLEGLVKGGLIEEAKLKEAGVITEELSYAFYIK